MAREILESHGIGYVDATGNAAIDLPDDPLLALWQQISVVREWRGDSSGNLVHHFDVPGNHNQLIIVAEA